MDDKDDKKQPASFDKEAFMFAFKGAMPQVLEEFSELVENDRRD